MPVHHEVSAYRVSATHLRGVLDLVVGDVLELQLKSKSALASIPVSTTGSVPSTTLKPTRIYVLVMAAIFATV